MVKTGKCVPKSKQLIYLRFSLFTDHLWWQVYHGWSSSLYLVPITLFSVLYNIPKFFELEVQNLSKKTTYSYMYNENNLKLLSSTQISNKVKNLQGSGTIELIFLKLENLSCEHYICLSENKHEHFLSSY